MKKALCLIFALSILLAGCSLPAGNNANDTAKSSLQPVATQDNKAGDIKNNTKDERTAQSGDKNSTGANDGKNSEAKESIIVTLYYEDSSGDVIPVTRKLAKQVGIARAAVNCLVDNVSNKSEMEPYGLYPVLPDGTEIKGLNIKEGTATIDFNDKLFDNDGKTAERNVISSIVYTLTNFNTVKNVKILINGRNGGKLKYGTDISGILNRENVLINSSKANLTKSLTKLDAYLFKTVDDKHFYIIPVSSEFNNLKNEDIPEKLVELASKEYGEKGLYTELPAGVKLLGHSINGDILTLNFNDKIRSYGGGTAREDGILKQILYSAKQVEGIKRVKILIDGKTGNLPEGTDISKELPVPVSINEITQ